MMRYEAGAGDEKQVQDALTALGRAMSTYAIYGTEHPISGTVLDTAYDQLSQFFEAQESLDIGVVGGRFVVDGQPFNCTNSLMKGIERKVIALGIVNLRLRKGLSREEFKKLVELLHRADEQQFKQAIGNDEFSNIDAEDDMEYRLVQKGEGEAAGAGTMAEPQAAEEEKSPRAEEPASSVKVDQIVAFMKGQPGLESAAVKEEVSKLASDPDKLGQLILESVVMRQSVQSIENVENLSDVVMGCLRKTFDGLKGMDAFQKRGGRASMKKALLLLEKSVLDRIHDAVGETDSKQDKEIVKAIKNMKMDLDIEQVVSRYSEQSEALERSRKKLSGYVGRRGIEEVRQFDPAGEIPMEQWRRIEVEGSASKKGSGGDGSGGEGLGASAAESLSGNLGALAVVLEKLDDLMHREDHRQNLDDLLGEAQQGLADQSARTEKKINELKRRISQEEASLSTLDSRASQMTVAELLGSVSEIAQELAQPLTAMDVVLEMVLKGYAGQVSDEQENLLSLASTSGDHMGHLLDQLKDIVGMPKNLGVDRRYHPDDPPLDANPLI